MYTATVTSKGQITIPVEVRRKLDLITGSKVDFMWDEEDNSFHLRRKTGSIKDLKGVLHDPNREPMTIEEMDEAIAESAMASYLESARQ